MGTPQLGALAPGPFPFLPVPCPHTSFESFPVITFCFLELWPPPAHLLTCLMFSKLLALGPRGFPFISPLCRSFPWSRAPSCQGRDSFCLPVTLCLEQHLVCSRHSVNTCQMHQHARWGVAGAACQLPLASPGTLLCPPLWQGLFSWGHWYPQPAAPPVQAFCLPSSF